MLMGGNADISMHVEPLPSEQCGVFLLPFQAVLDAVTCASPSGQLSDAHISAELHGILVTSFNRLNPAPQNMFLDIVSVLHGADSRDFRPIWNRWWGGADLHLAALQRLALVSIDEDEHTLQVHDVIRSFGRGIILGSVQVKAAGGAAASFVGSRLWVEEDGRLVTTPEVSHDTPPPSATVNS